MVASIVGSVAGVKREREDEEDVGQKGSQNQEVDEGARGGKRTKVEVESSKDADADADNQLEEDHEKTEQDFSHK